MQYFPLYQYNQVISAYDVLLRLASGEDMSGSTATSALVTPTHVILANVGSFLVLLCVDLSNLYNGCKRDFQFGIRFFF